MKKPRRVPCSQGRPRPSMLDPATIERLASAPLPGRIGSPADFVEIVAFLASPQAAYVTGAEILVDGGHLLPMMMT